MSWWMRDTSHSVRSSECTALGAWGRGRAAGSMRAMMVSMPCSSPWSPAFLAKTMWYLLGMGTKVFFVRCVSQLLPLLALKIL